MYRSSAKKSAMFMPSDRSSKRQCLEQNMGAGEGSSGDDESPRGQQRQGLLCFAWGKTETMFFQHQQEDLIQQQAEEVNQEPVEAIALRGENVTQIACGRSGGDAYALTSDGEVKRWGPSSELGGWDSVTHEERTLGAESFLPGVEVTMLKSGPRHFAALDRNGRLYTWGDGEHGKLGHGNEFNVAKPKVIDLLEGAPYKAKEVDCGYCHTVMLTEQGRVYTFGWNSSGRTGHNTQRGKTLLPRLVDRLSQLEIGHIAAGGCHTAVVTAHSKRVFTWGSGEQGRLGHGTEGSQFLPKEVDRLQNLDVRVRQVVCGRHHTAVVTDEGKVYCWGNNDDGQLGNGSDEEVSLYPTRVQGLDSIVVDKLVLGCANSLAITAEGVYLWGSSSLAGNVQGSTSILAPERLGGSLACQSVVDAFSFGFNGLAVLVDGSKEQRATDFVPIATALNNFVGDERFSDVTFLVGTDGQQQTIHAHRIILIQKCEYFRTMFESNLRESSEKVIPIPNVEPETFKLMLRYLYTDKVRVEIESAIQLYNLAEMYFLERLKILCCKAVKDRLTCDSAAPVLKMAVDCQCTAIKNICMDFIVSNYVKVAPTEGMKQLGQRELLEIIQVHARRLQNNS